MTANVYDVSLAGDRNIVESHSGDGCTTPTIF